MEEKQRFQAKKKEAWEFFRKGAGGIRGRIQAEGDDWILQRQPRGREKYLDEWTRLEARERVKMGEEDAVSRRRTEWERIFDRSPFLKAAS